MFRALLAIGLSLFLLGVDSCPKTTETVCKPEVLLNSPYKDQVLAADRFVKKTFPEWYQKGTCITIDPDKQYPYAEASRLKTTGEIYISLYLPSLELETTEGLAHILLHEYVHVTQWKKGKNKHLTDACRIPLDELDAYNVTIHARPKLKSSSDLHTGALILYGVMYVYVSEYCAEEDYKDFPRPADQPQ